MVLVLCFEKLKIKITEHYDFGFSISQLQSQTDLSLIRVVL